MFSYYKRNTYYSRRIWWTYLSIKSYKLESTTVQFSLDLFPFFPISLGLCYPTGQPLAACNLASLSPVLSLCSLARHPGAVWIPSFCSCSLEITFRQKIVVVLGLPSFAPLFLRDHSHTLPLVHYLTTVCPVFWLFTRGDQVHRFCHFILCVYYNWHIFGLCEDF